MHTEIILEQQSSSVIHSSSVWLVLFDLSLLANEETEIFYCMKPPTLEILLWTKVNNVSKVPCRFLFNSLGVWWPFDLLAFITHDNESVPIFLPKSHKSFTVKNPKLSI